MKACEAEGGELIKPDTARINKWIGKQTSDKVYIGANDRVRMDGWMDGWMVGCVLFP